MSIIKKQAIEIIDQLHVENRIDYSDYSSIREGLDEIETLRDRDEKLEELWAQFGDVPMNPETECIEQPFLGWGTGVHREEIWHWFDRRHSKGVAYLLCGDGIDKTDQIANAGMIVPKELLNFLRDQFPEGSRIRIRKHGGDVLLPGRLGVLNRITANARFCVTWEDGQHSELVLGADNFFC